MTTYKNLTDHELVIPNVGLVPPRGTIESDLDLSSTNLQPITNLAPAHQEPVQAAPEPPQEGEN